MTHDDIPERRCHLCNVVRDEPFLAIDDGLCHLCTSVAQAAAALSPYTPLGDDGNPADLNDEADDNGMRCDCVVDLLVDLLHYCDRYDVDFKAQLRVAKGHVFEERIE